MNSKIKYIFIILPIFFRFILADKMTFLYVTLISMILFWVTSILMNKKINKSLKLKQILFTTFLILSVYYLIMWFVYAVFGTFMGLTLDKITIGLINFNTSSNLDSAQIFIWLGLIFAIFGYLFYFLFIKERFRDECKNNIMVIKKGIKEYKTFIFPISIIYTIFILLYYFLVCFIN